jgi:hypothetical protein
MRRQGGMYPNVSPLGLQYTDQVAKGLKGKLPKDAFGVRVYDSFRLKAGQATTTNEFRFFTTPVGQQAFVLNAPTEAYAKTRFDTNMSASGLLEQGQMLVIRSMQIQVVIPSQTDTTYPTSGPATELASNPAAAAAVSGVNLMTSVLDQTYFQFYAGEHGYEEGPGWMWPSNYGMSGFAGFGISTDFEGVANNGFGRAWPLPIERQIPALTTFYVLGQFIQALTISRNCVLRCILEGIKFRPVQ